MEKVRDWARGAIECAIETQAKHVTGHFVLTREDGERVREKSFLTALRNSKPGFHKSLVTFVVTAVQRVGTDTGEEWQVDICASFRYLLTRKVTQRNSHDAPHHPRRDGPFRLGSLDAR